MTRGLKRYHLSRQTHFLTFSCYRRMRLFHPTEADLFLCCLEQIRRRFHLRIFGYVVMPEHVHLLVSEPEQAALSTAVQSLKLAVSKRLRPSGPNSFRFWQSRYYDFNVHSHKKFIEKLQYIHRNPVHRGLVSSPEQWLWSSFRHYSDRETGVVEIESEQTASLRLSSSKATSPR